MYFSKNFFLSNIEKYYISVGTVYFIINKMLSLIMERPSLQYYIQIT